MQYLSTRGAVSALQFSDSVMMGLATDGGLLLPRNIPRIGANTFSSWGKLSYPDLAFEVMSRFIADIPENDLRELIIKSYSTFDTEEVTPLVHCGPLHILELFHGPTLAFKDIALQFLGNLFAYILARNNSSLNIIGATSGDTGSAAIYGVRGKEGINIFILHPKGRISKVQEMQMTSVTDANVHNIAIEGSFDDGQAIVKSIFNDIDFKNTYHLGSINSINWARVLAQVVYYVYSALHVTSHENYKAMDFSVPTGNFGDIFAGYIAKQLLPEGTIRKLILATNENDILTRFVTKGDYSKADVCVTSSPSMDIQAASNFERYLYYLFDKDPKRTAEAMTQFADTGCLDLSSYLDTIKRDFDATSATKDDVLETIASFQKNHGYTLDPHTAVGVFAARQKQQKNIPIICLSTAHPAKFADTVQNATGIVPEPPPAIAGILERESKCKTMAADENLVKSFIVQHSNI